MESARLADEGDVPPPFFIERPLNRRRDERRNPEDVLEPRLGEEVSMVARGHDDVRVEPFEQRVVEKRPDRLVQMVRIADDEHLSPGNGAQVRWFDQTRRVRPNNDNLRLWEGRKPGQRLC
ncbi:MAG TPA: hypothetical protein VHC69_09250 [Polyangiaceae bacterium]|nr:hypothetical protein [Polyangiaceae bacterium]